MKRAFERKSVKIFLEVLEKFPGKFTSLQIEMLDIDLT